MDYLGEIIVLGIDSIVFGICLKQYFHYTNAIKAVEKIECYEDGTNLAALIAKTPHEKIDYVAIKGVVKPLAEPLYSINKDNVTGAIQKLTVKEHVVARSTAGLWTDQERTIQKIYNSVPFALKQGKCQVEILDPLAADVLDMDTISNHFQPIVPTFTDHLWGFFTGVRQRGLQFTEEMLREGTVITGLGELSKSVTKPNSLVLQPPVTGAPFYLTSMSISGLLRKLSNHKKIYRWLCLLSGAIGLLISGVIARRYWKDREEQRLAEERRQSLAASRKERRGRVRDKDLRKDQLCIVCNTSAREIIILPCGHVCLCEDCSDDITNHCPVCRAPIAQKCPAYII